MNFDHMISNARDAAKHYGDNSVQQCEKINTDIERLKLAAKAAGHEVVRVADDGEALMLHGVQEPWNPRKNGEQALRLAGCLGFTVRPGYCVMVTSHGPGFGCDPYPDAYDATLEAIVIAASELGKKIPG
jgi:hypothetical protein